MESKWKTLSEQIVEYQNENAKLRAEVELLTKLSKGLADARDLEKEKLKDVLLQNRELKKRLDALRLAMNQSSTDRENQLDKENAELMLQVEAFRMALREIKESPMQCTPAVSPTASPVYCFGCIHKTKLAMDALAGTEKQVNTKCPRCGIMPAHHSGMCDECYEQMVREGGS